MEFLRFGSSIPGAYWGCCACDIIQNFKVDPDAKASIQIVGGDGGQAVGDVFAGPTNRDIFNQRIRVGTFGGSDMPNHAFLAIITEWQVNSEPGKKWLAILKENGFEFIRTVNNSVYSGSSLGEPTGQSQNNDNHIFGLFRNIGSGGLKDPFMPPKAWADLPKVVPEAWELLTATEKLTEEQHKGQTTAWNKVGKAKFLTEAEVVAAGAPVIYAGLRSGGGNSPEPVHTGFSGARPETKENRELRRKQFNAMVKTWTDAGKPLFDTVDPFAVKAAPAPASMAI